MATDKSRQLVISDSSACETPAEAVERLSTLYDEQIDTVKARFDRFSEGALDRQDQGHGVYPAVMVEIPAEQSVMTSSLALGRVAEQHDFATTISRPQLYAEYLTNQLRKIQERFSATIRVGLSNQPIPLTFALEAATAALSPEQRNQIPTYFHTPDLIRTNDDIVDGKQLLNRDGLMPLSLFTAERVDYSLYRIRHYTATDPEAFQPFILLTNYQRYVDEFCEWAIKKNLDFTDSND